VDLPRPQRRHVLPAQPVGRVFYEYLGETVFRTDLDNSDVELGDLLVHEGPAREAEAAAAAAEIFGADRTYFVLNGTSTSNKVAAGALVSRGDLVLFDRNNHKSSHHGALVLAGGIPVYLSADRNPQGLIGPIDPGALDEDRIRAAIRDCPLVTDSHRWRAERPFRLAIIEQCSYDGTVYNVRAILDRIGHPCDYVLFDEAWAGFMKFHPLFARPGKAVVRRDPQRLVRRSQVPDLNAVAGRHHGRAARRVGGEHDHAHRRDRPDVAEDARDAPVE
jgi:arginine/lysine/ornithine decarboxylase